MTSPRFPGSRRDRESGGSSAGTPAQPTSGPPSGQPGWDSGQGYPGQPGHPGPPGSGPQAGPPPGYPQGQQPGQPPALPPGAQTPGGRPGPTKLTVTRVAATRTREITRATVDKINAASRADGAGETGLTTLFWNNALSMAGDALVLISLAGTLFFSAPGEQQRGNVALYLLVTVAPFALIAPVIGPMLDRLQRGRRYAIAATMAGRLILCWVLAANYTNFGLYPAALGLMVLSKAYAVLKGSVVPRVLPEQITLIGANARMNIFGLVTAGVLGAVGLGITNVPFLGFGWELGFTMVVFGVGTWVSLRLPARVDVDEGEYPASVMRSGEAGRRSRRGRTSLGPHVVTALRASAAQRGLGGFLTFFLAFFIQETLIGFDGWLALGALGGAAAAGSLLGTGIGARMRLTNPDTLVLVTTGVAVAVCVVAAILTSLVLAITVAFVAGVASALGKFALDAIIQREVPPQLVSSAFGRSETLLQLAWVFGGALGIVLPTHSGLLWLGFTVAAVLLVVSFGLTLLGRRKHLMRAKQAPDPTASGPQPPGAPTSYGGGMPPQQGQPPQGAYPAQGSRPTQVMQPHQTQPQPTQPHPTQPHPSQPTWSGGAGATEPTPRWRPGTWEPEPWQTDHWAGRGDPTTPHPGYAPDQGAGYTPGHRGEDPTSARQPWSDPTRAEPTAVDPNPGTQPDPTAWPDGVRPTRPVPYVPPVDPDAAPHQDRSHPRRGTDAR